MDEDEDSGVNLSEDDVQQLMTHAPENRPKGGFLTADPDPTDADCSGLAVRLDVAVIAVRLTAWKAVTRIYPKKRITILQGVQNWIENWIQTKSITFLGRKIAKEAAKDVAEQLVRWLGVIVSVLEAQKNAREVEQLIRGQCHVVRRQLIAQALPKIGRKRRKVVATRHVTN